jgi:hypothetical protein
MHRLTIRKALQNIAYALRVRAAKIKIQKGVLTYLHKRKTRFSIINLEAKH